MNREILTTLQNDGYEFIRQLPDGRIIGVRSMLYTVGLSVGLSKDGYSGRYCFESFSDAVASILEWDGGVDPPGKWIKYKGEGGERRNPNLK